MTGNLFTYHIIEGELRSLRHDVTVNGHHGAAIVVDAVSVTAPLVGVQVDSSALQRHQQTASRTTLPRRALCSASYSSAYLGGGRLDQVDPLVSFAELVVACGRVGEDFNAVPTHLNVRAEERTDVSRRASERHRTCWQPLPTCRGSRARRRSQCRCRCPSWRARSHRRGRCPANRNEATKFRREPLTRHELVTATAEVTWPVTSWIIRGRKYSSTCLKEPIRHTHF